MTQSKTNLSRPVRFVQDLTLDPATRDVVFQKLDEATGKIVCQYPCEMQLRLRAYNQAALEAHTRVASVETTA